jgi:hypothetical protein
MLPPINKAGIPLRDDLRIEGISLVIIALCGNT